MPEGDGQSRNVLQTARKASWLIAPLGPRGSHAHRVETDGRNGDVITEKTKRS